MPAPPELTQTLLALSFAFMMVLCRCGAALALMPGFAEEGPPAMLRVGVAVALAVLLTPVIGPRLPPLPGGFAPLAGLIMGELAAGFLLGWLARLVALALPAAGQIMSLTTGHSSVLQPDQDFGAHNAAIGQLLGRLAPVLILGSGLYALPLLALAGSYDVLPAGGLMRSGDLASLAVHAVGGHFRLAVQLAAPFLLVSFVWHAGLGLVSRLVPHIQMHFATLPGQVLGGVLLLALLAAPLARHWLGAVAAVFAALPGG